MSFSSLKKSTQSDRPRLVTVDQFIDDAVTYSHGGANTDLLNQPLKVVNSTQAKPPKMKRATYTLDLATLDDLTALSERTGISRSRIIRIFTQQHCSAHDTILLDSDIK